MNYFRTMLSAKTIPELPKTFLMGPSQIVSKTKAQLGHSTLRAKRGLGDTVKSITSGYRVFEV